MSHSVPPHSGTIFQKQDTLKEAQQEVQDPWLSVLILRWVWLSLEEVLSSQQGKRSLLGAEHIQFEVFSHGLTS